MDKKKEIEHLAKDIRSLLNELEHLFWEIHVVPAYGYHDEPSSNRIDHEKRDKRMWLFRGTVILYYKICFFLELKNAPLYHKMFVAEFESIINDEQKVIESHGPIYSEDTFSMVIHDKFNEFLSPFHEFNYSTNKDLKTHGLQLILQNSHAIISQTNTTINNETSIYKIVRWFVEIVYPSTRKLSKARFIQKFKTYEPDILVPEINSAVEYKYIRKGKNLGEYLDQIKTDADNYTGDPQYRYFYAVVYYEDKSQINIEAFNQAVKEKSFPKNWTIMPV